MHIRYIGKYSDTTTQSIVTNQAIEKNYAIAAGKLRRFHGKKWYWYFTQPGLVARNIKDSLLFSVGFVQSISILIFWRPNVVFVKGGYVGLPVGLAAACLRIAIVTHDSDVLPGLTNRILSKFARTLAVGAPVDQYPQYANKTVIYTGVPVRNDFIQPPLKSAARKQLGIPKQSHVVAIVGGSLGAVRVNDAILVNLDKLFVDTFKSLDSPLKLLWFTGAHGYKKILHAVEKTSHKDNIIVEPYTNDLATVFSAADVVITRAGATTLAELSIMKKPSVIIPNPLLTGGHQTMNARVYQQHNAAIVVTEKQLADSPLILSGVVKDVLMNQEKQLMLSDNMSTFARVDAAKDIAHLLLAAGNRNSGV